MKNYRCVLASFCVSAVEVYDPSMHRSTDLCVSVLCVCVILLEKTPLFVCVVHTELPSLRMVFFAVSCCCCLVVVLACRFVFSVLVFEENKCRPSAGVAAFTLLMAAL